LQRCHSFDKLKTASEAKPKNLNLREFMVTSRLIMRSLH
jgi:hypothetical protein